MKQLRRPKQTKFAMAWANTRGDVWYLAIFILGYIAGNLSSSSFFYLKPTDQSIADEKLSIQNNNKRPLQLFPLLKDLGCGWGNMEAPPLLHKAAEGKRSLIVDIGLDEGTEFFEAMAHGFEVVGMEPNPTSFSKLQKICNFDPKCNVVDLKTAELPLKREPGHSYLINAGAGSENGVFTLAVQSAVSSIGSKVNKDTTLVDVQVVRIDEIIDEDIYLLKTDTQGFDQKVIEGATKVFQNHVVRQVITEVDPLNLSHHNHDPSTLLGLLQDNGMVCFQARTDNKDRCQYYGESIEGFMNVFKIKGNPKIGTKYDAGLFGDCWEDFICINVEEVYSGNHPPSVKAY